MVRAIDKLTPEDAAALWQFARVANCGVRWKGALRRSWETGVYNWRCSPDLKAQLQSIRNRLGPSFLASFKLEAHR